MRMTAPAVVAGWGLANGLLVALLAGMGGSAVVIAIYGCAVALIGVIAVAVVISRRRRASRPRTADPPAASALLVATAALLAALGLAFGWWTAFLAVPLLVAAVIYEGYEYRKRAER